MALFLRRLTLYPTQSLLAPVLSKRCLSSSGNIKMPKTDDNLPLNEDEKNVKEAMDRNINKYIMLFRRNPDDYPEVKDDTDVPRTLIAIATPPDGGWGFYEDSKAAHVRTEMPGLGKEDIKVICKPKMVDGCVEVKVKVEGQCKTKRMIKFNHKLFKVDERVKAKMINGLLTLSVPMKTDEDKQEIIKIQVN